jgi:hypothetical protein
MSKLRTKRSTLLDDVSMIAMDSHSSDPFVRSQSQPTITSSSNIDRTLLTGDLGLSRGQAKEDDEEEDERKLQIAHLNKLLLQDLRSSNNWQRQLVINHNDDADPRIHILNKDFFQVLYTEEEITKWILQQKLHVQYLEELQRTESVRKLYSKAHKEAKEIDEGKEDNLHDDDNLIQSHDIHFYHHHHSKNTRLKKYSQHNQIIISIKEAFIYMIEIYLSLNYPKKAHRNRLAKKIYKAKTLKMIIVSDLVIMMKECWKIFHPFGRKLTFDEQKHVLHNFYIWVEAAKDYNQYQETFIPYKIPYKALDTIFQQSQTATTAPPSPIDHRTSLLISFRSFMTWFDSVMEWMALSPRLRWQLHVESLFQAQSGQPCTTISTSTPSLLPSVATDHRWFLPVPQRFEFVPMISPTNVTKFTPEEEVEYEIIQETKRQQAAAEKARLQALQKQHEHDQQRQLGNIFQRFMLRPQSMVLINRDDNQHSTNTTNNGTANTITNVGEQISTTMWFFKPN